MTFLCRLSSSSLSFKRAAYAGITVTLAANEIQLNLNLGRARSPPLEFKSYRTELVKQFRVSETNRNLIFFNTADIPACWISRQSPRRFLPKCNRSQT